MIQSDEVVQESTFAMLKFLTGDVRFGSLASFLSALADVRFTPQSDRDCDSRPVA